MSSEPDASDAAPEKEELPPLDFYVVGVGASAGGLEAIRELLEKTELERLAVVVVQHLAREHESMLPALLARVTRSEVTEAKDGVKLEPGHVYVIPPDADLAVLQHTLHLMPPSGGARRLPVDYFLRSLAEDLGHRAIGVVLSGTGSDGTLGLKTVKQAGGLTFAQEPTEAKFDQMPRSARDSGWADFSLPINGIARELSAVGRRPGLTIEQQPNAPTQEVIGKLIVLMRTAFGNDLTYYKPTTIERRIERRLVLHKLDRLEDYLRFVISNPAELRLLYNDMLIGVTGFFRDREPFDILKTSILPRLLEGREVGGHIRVWVPACSTGEEAYSFAMCLLEYLDTRAQDFRLQIFGTDVDEVSIAAARQGIYPQNIALDLSPERLHRFFVKKDEQYQVARRVRDMVVFSVQNLTRDPPFSRLDLVSCRNLLIYLQPPMQKKVLRILHYALNPSGYLMLGTSETVGESSELFSLVDRKAKVYAKKHAAGLGALDIGFGVNPPELVRPIQPGMNHRGAANISSLAERKILELFGPPGVVVNDDFEVVHIRGRTGPYLEPMPGTPSFNLLKLARPEIHVDLRRALHEAREQNTRVTLESRVNEAPGTRPFRLEVVPIIDPETRARCFLVLFHEPLADATLKADIAPEAPSTPEAQRVQELERELTVTKEYLQSTVEELETGAEELKSSNEELQSSNEELQSTNEELETSKEELQSANEELTTVNDELQSRMSELQQSNDDLHNVLSGVGDAVVIIGMDLRIRRYTHTAEKTLNLVPGDIGRSVSLLNAFVQGQRVDQLASDVISRLQPVMSEVLGANGRWYELDVKPYRTLDHTIKGAVVMLVDIDARRRAGDAGSNVVVFAEELYRLVDAPLAIVDRHQTVVWCNAAFGARFGVDRDAARKSPLSRFASEPALAPLIDRALAEGRAFSGFESKGLKLNGSRLPPIGGEAALVLLAFT